MKKKFISVMLAFTMIFAITACGSVSTEKTAKTGAIDSTSQPSTEAETVAEKTAITPGNFVELGNYKFSFESAKQYDKISDPDDPDGFWDEKPSEGKKYLVLFFEVENISNESQHVNIFYSKAYLDDYEISETTLMAKPEGYGSLSGDLAPGKKLKGCVCYEVNPDWQKLEYTYTDGVFDSSPKYDFMVTPDLLTK